MSASHTPSESFLFGILALQLDFISQDHLDAAMKSWREDKSRKLDEILVEQGALMPSVRDVLLPVVQQHIEAHDGDPAKSLAVLRGTATEDVIAPGDQSIDATESLARMDSGEPTIDYRVTLGVVGSDGRLGTASDRFRILRPHARGGLGEVSIAKDLELNRDVALKEIQSRYANDEVSRSRFLLEAEVTGGLEHPGIVPVYGLGRYKDGRPFYAMRFIKGDSLKEAADQFHREATGTHRSQAQFRSVEFRKLLGRLVDVCEAIEYAHSRGVLHRDLKPGNVMLGKYGETLVVDWGLAKTCDREDAEAGGESQLHPASASGEAATEMGSAIGTPAFMPPEQAAGRVDQLGPASDVYSLGATLYYLLTGQAPVQKKEIAAVLRDVQDGTFAAPCEIQAHAPKALQAVCLKAMSLEPDNRYSTPRSLAEDIELYLADEPVATQD